MINSLKAAAYHLYGGIAMVTKALICGCCAKCSGDASAETLAGCTAKKMTPAMAAMPAKKENFMMRSLEKWW